MKSFYDLVPDPVKCLDLVLMVPAHVLTLEQLTLVH